MNTPLSSAASPVTYDDGRARQVFRVLQDGTCQDGEEVRCLSGPDTTWRSPTNWTTWATKRVVQVSQSPGLAEGRWFASLELEVRAVIRTHYGLTATGTFPCREARNGCARKVARKGDYCSHCINDQ